MRIVKFMIGLALAIVVAGCATSNFTVGRDFPSAKVSQIVKGKTTSAELLRIFGKPFKKKPVSAIEEEWIYTYVTGKVHAQSYIVTMKAESSGYKKTLDILLKNGTVINYTYTEGPTPVRTLN